MKNKKVLLSLTAVFVIIEAMCGYLIFSGSAFQVRFFSFLSIIFACAFCSIFIERSKDYAFTQIALICTVIADYFLVWCVPQIKLPAMCFFLITQISYTVRIYFSFSNNKIKTVQTILHSVFSPVIALITFIVLGDNTDALSIVSMIYYVTLALNIVFAFLQFKKNYLLAIGLLLFICCDTVIGLDMLKSYLPISPDALIYKIIYPGFNLAWAFYLPSQVIIATSLLPKRFKKT